MMRRLGVLLATALLAGACGLGGPAHEALPPLDNPELAERCRERLEARYPERYRLRQRIRLESPAGEEAFDAYLWADLGPSFRALAFAPMAGKWLDLRHRNGESRILTNVPEFPEDLLLEGVMGDILHLYGPGLEERSTSAEESWQATPEGGARCIRRWPDGAWTLRDFSPRGRLLLSEAGRDRQVLRRASYEDYRDGPDWDRPLPHRIRLDNPRWRYRLDIELLRLLPREDNFLPTGERP